MTHTKQALRITALGVTVLLAAPAVVQQAAAQQAAVPPTASAKPLQQTQPPPSAPAEENAASPFLRVYFNTGSATLRPEDYPVLDKASRTYRVGQPIVMILTGSTDATGPALANLDLSQRRAVAVLTALVARGIPAEKFQILAKGETEPAVPDPANTPQPQDRSVEIAWR